MNTIFTRSAVIFHRGSAPPELAYLVGERGHFRVVTWKEVMEERRKRQAEQLRRKRDTATWRAYRLWCAYFDQDLMGGWQVMLEDWRGRDFSIWIDRDRQWLRPVLMDLFPVILPLGTVEQRWEHWKPVFAQAYERRKQDRHPLGVAYLWWNQHDKPRLTLSEGKYEPHQRPTTERHTQRPADDPQGYK